MRSLTLLLATWLLQACSTLTAPATPSAESALTTERRWLQSWFEGTPVVIAQQRDGIVLIEVPRPFCFDAGRTTVKPALAAVLDKVAQSLRRAPNVRLLTLAAPDDGAEAGWLAARRAEQVRRHLLGRGAPAAQLGEPTRSDAAAVRLRMGPAPS